MSIFLLEIGTEELPADFASSALSQFEGIVRGDLKQKRLAHGPIKCTSTPRRIVLLVNTWVRLGGRVIHSALRNVFLSKAGWFSSMSALKKVIFEVVHLSCNYTCACVTVAQLHTNRNELLVIDCKLEWIAFHWSTSAGIRSADQTHLDKSRSICILKHHHAFRQLSNTFR